MFGPQPRFRIYTTPSDYSDVFKDILVNRVNKGDAMAPLCEQIKALFGVRYVLPMPTARYAIYLSLKAIITPGQKVILSPLTIVDVINMVICAGGVPVFCDVEEGTCNIAADKIEALMDADVGAIMITHLHGLACDVDTIKAIAEKHNVPLIEDSAQAFTTQVNKKMCGTFGDIGIFSFGMYKNVNAFFGGMLITDNADYYEQIKQAMSDLKPFPLKRYLHKFIFAGLTDLSTQPMLFPCVTYRIFKYAFLKQVDFINNIVTVDRNPVRQDSLPDAYACTMNDIQARLILKKLPAVAANNKHRIATAQRYHDGLSDIEALVLPPLRTDQSHIYTYFPIQCADRRALMRHGLQNGRDWVLSHYHNCATLDIFQEFKRDCPNASATANGLLYLPTYPRYKEKEVLRNINVIRQFFNKDPIT